MQSLNAFILSSTGANKIIATEILQTLWAGHGHIKRITLEGYQHKSVILKEINFTPDQKHTRGWDTKTSIQRKIKTHMYGFFIWVLWVFICVVILVFLQVR